MSVEFVDTNILLYAHDADSKAKQPVAIELVARLALSGQGALSAQVLTEFYAVATRKLGMSPDDAADVIEDLQGWSYHAPSHLGILRATRLQRRHKISWRDALILASALELGCKTLWSEDFQDGRKFGSLTVRNPFA